MQLALVISVDSNIFKNITRLGSTSEISALHSSFITLIIQREEQNTISLNVQYNTLKRKIQYSLRKGKLQFPSEHSKKGKLKSKNLLPSSSLGSSSFC